MRDSGSIVDDGERGVAAFDGKWAKVKDEILE
jgi:hypothetical protein